MIAKYKVVFFGGMKLQFKTYGTYITQPAHCIRESVKKNSFEKYVEFYNSLQLDNSSTHIFKIKLT